jgi:hypothetical protein
MLPDWLDRAVTDAKTALGLYDGYSAEATAIYSLRDLERLAAETARTDPWTAARKTFGGDQ